VYLGWATAAGTGHRLLRLDGDPQQVLDDTTSAAVALLADLVEQRDQLTTRRPPRRARAGLDRE
jgi:nicotinamide-nucleotide amidase